jgi:hypothetical protein
MGARGVDIAEEETVHDTPCLLAYTLVTRPLCPTLVHDPVCRAAVCAAGIVACLAALVRIMRYFSGP